MTRNKRDGDPDYSTETIEESEECDHCGEESNEMGRQCPHCGESMDKNSILF
jgi:predicted amidophosphoribosyltransferase